jgi:hypothetical protein
VQCRLPVLYAKSGGFPEVVRTNGIGIPDNSSDIRFRDEIPDLSFFDIRKAYRKFMDQYENMVNNYSPLPKYMVTLSQYFDVMESLVERY